MGYKKYLVLSMVFWSISIVEAAEWWILPNKYFFEVGETARIGLVQGEGLRPEPWPLAKDQVVTIEHHYAMQVEDLRPALIEDDRERLKLKFNQGGTHALTLQSARMFRAQEAEAFNTFLEENGLEEILTKRNEPHVSTKPVGEFYTIYTKLLVQVGAETSDVYKKKVGFPIEILPEKNPYALKTGERMRFKILKDGKPLFGIRVKVWNRKDNRTTLQNIYTEKDGTIETRLSSVGPWMISVVQLEPSKEAGAEWQSTLSTLVFGIR